MVAADKLDQILARFEFLEAKMSTGLSGAEIATLSREYAELRPVVETITSYRRIVADISDAEAMLKDPEMRALAEDELPELREALEAAEHRWRRGGAVRRRSSADVSALLRDARLEV
jgi:peptide chain release factor 1